MCSVLALIISTPKSNHAQHREAPLRRHVIASPTRRAGADVGRVRRYVWAVSAAAAGSYWSRLGIYLLCATAGSMYGATFTWSSTWNHANPLTAGRRAALISLGPAIVLAAAASLRRVEITAVGACFGIAMVVMWGLFTSSESSSSAVVFVWGWLAGLPASGVLLAVADRHSRLRN